MKFDALKADEKGLVPAIIQDAKSKEVLMLGYMNQEAFEKTKEEKMVWFFSRSRNQLWKKGESSGNTLFVSNILVDCDNDTILVQAYPAGPTCHTGKTSCFYQEIFTEETSPGTALQTGFILKDIWQVVADRAKHPKEGSYTNYLLDKGLDKMLKKVGEEAAEVIIAAKNREPSEVRYETADLLYHLSVVLYEQGLTWDEVLKELENRR